MTRLDEVAVPSRNNVVHDNSGCGRGGKVAHEQATLLPVNLDVGELPVTVVGGGGAALRRVAALLQAGAEVTVVAAHVVPAIEDLADRGQLHWVRRDLRADDLGPACLVMAATGRLDQDAAVADQARTRHVLCLRADGHAPAQPTRTVPARASGSPRRGEGRVVLVGGGPGDPGLITVRGMEVLAAADVVVVDRLAPVGVLSDLADDVEVVDVSKVPRGRFTPQEQINDLLVEHARRGSTVVRLKGGDPFVFGRGMEEAQACAAAGVPVEVVPGVTSAVSVPALAGIPVTHRGLSQGFSVVSGHVPPGHPDSTVDWGALARSGTTLVVLMGVHTLPLVVATLLAEGREPGTPLACVVDGASAAQQVVVSTLAEVASSGVPALVRPPAIVVIGPVVGAGPAAL
jgi:uroporphyrin-III C-methyltransferase / precorrin-2 dehydrogenase / sirohydrochlorin ferrochelatase